MNNSRQLKELIKVNLLYANPQVTSQLRKKGKHGNAIFRSILLQQAFLSALFIVLYGGTMLMIDFSKLPGIFTNYMAIFSILSFSQGISVVFNVFFDSKDFEDYLPLPFSQKNIFLAKMLIVAFFLLPFTLPLIALFILTAIGGEITNFIMIPGSIIIFLLFLIILLEIVILLVSLLVHTALFKRFKTLFTTLLMFIPTVGMLVGMIYLNQKQSNVYEAGVIKDQGIIPVLNVFHSLLTNPLSTFSMVGLAILFITIGLLAFLIKKQVLPNMQTTSDLIIKGGKKESYKSLQTQLIKYQFSLIKNPTLQMQMLSSLIIFPVILLMPMLINGEGDFSFLPMKYFGAFIVGGLLFSKFTLGANSLASVIISLDQANLPFFKSLPLSFKSYIKIKFRFAFILQVILSSIVLLVTCIVVKLPVTLILGLLIGNLVGCHMGTSHYLKRDYKYLSLNWTNVNQLFNRGMGSFEVVISIFGVMIIGTIIIFLLVAIINMSNQAVVVNFIVLLLLTSSLIVYQRFINRRFWNELKE